MIEVVAQVTEVAKAEAPPSTTNQKQFSYCVVCRLNYTHGKKHLFQKTHQEALLEAVRKEYEKIEAVKYLMKTPVQLNEHEIRENYFCLFCQCDINTSKDKLKGLVIISYNTFF